ncbi:MAG: tetratricopeptide repeat protein [Verrucomicrobiota bacterium]|nr:tetratricopeptide repeat protein [Verrucomicrobiota bacterium]
MRLPRKCVVALLHGALGLGLFFAIASPVSARSFWPLKPRSAPPAKAIPVKHSSAVDDSTRLTPAPDLALTNFGLRKADALANFVEGARLEENGEVDDALVAYQKVLTVDPGEIQLASRVASLLVRQDNIPLAIDVLKDAIKANPKETGPYLQLAFIYAKFLQKPEQAVKFANEAIALDPEDIDAYQRVYEIELASGDAKKAMAVLERAAKGQSRNPAFWTRLGRLFASLLLDNTESPEGVQRVNAIFKRALAVAGEDTNILKEVADYYAASQQMQEAIPIYLRILELKPDDQQVREKLATGFVATNQREKAITLLEQVISKTPEKYQAYELLAQLQDEDGRALLRAKQTEPAKAQFAKAAANYEQCILINPNRGQTYLRLAELLVGPLGQADRAEKILNDARSRFAQAPEFTYFLAIAQREAKHAQQAVITFEEAAQEAGPDSELLNARFYFDYGAAAEQAGFFEKAADLLKKSIALDPPKAAEACNYLGYMWAEHDMHLDEAEEMIKKALELDPDNGAYLDSRGWLAYRKGNYDDALRDLLRAAQSLTRDDPVVFEHVGDTYAKLNRAAQALEYWQKASALSPENKMLAEKIESTKTKMSKGDPAKPLPVP